MLQSLNYPHSWATILTWLITGSQRHLLVVHLVAEKCRLLPSDGFGRGLWAVSTSCLSHLGPLSYRSVNFETESLALLEGTLPALEFMIWSSAWIRGKKEELRAGTEPGMAPREISEDQRGQHGRWQEHMAESFISWKKATPGWLSSCKIPPEPELADRIYMDWQPQYPKRERKKNPLIWAS